MNGRTAAIRNRRLGASAVEFAVVAPVFFLLIFGMIEYGRLVMVQQVLTNATREGARRAVLQDATSNAVTTTIRDYLTNASINGNNPHLAITVSPAPESAQPTDESITVTLTLPFADISWLPSPMFLGTTTLTARSVMRRETFE
ncbi:MAG: pilus assembly protein [Planctomycetes bacterium]|nr:pilus assembly protein [Planctomycetota bacterium]